MFTTPCGSLGDSPGSERPSSRRHLAGVTPRPSLRVTAGHGPDEIPEMPFLLVEKGGVARLYAERRQNRVLVREWIPAERREVEGEALW
jgi:hypothetical protein